MSFSLKMVYSSNHLFLRVVRIDWTQSFTDRHQPVVLFLADTPISSGRVISVGIDTDITCGGTGRSHAASIPRFAQPRQTPKTGKCLGFISRMLNSMTEKFIIQRLGRQPHAAGYLLTSATSSGKCKGPSGFGKAIGHVRLTAKASPRTGRLLPSPHSG